MTKKERFHFKMKPLFPTSKIKENSIVILQEFYQSAFGDVHSQKLY